MENANTSTSGAIGVGAMEAGEAGEAAAVIGATPCKQTAKEKLKQDNDIKKGGRAKTQIWGLRFSQN